MRIFASIVFLLIFGVVALVYFYLKGSDELQSKPEWSVLQNLEFRYRTNPIASRLLIEKQDAHCAVGIVSADGQSRVWLLLNAAHEPLVKKLPELEYWLSEAEFTKILGACKINEQVRSELVAHIAR